MPVKCKEIIDKVYERFMKDNLSESDWPHHDMSSNVTMLN